MFNFFLTVLIAIRGLFGIIQPQATVSPIQVQTVSGSSIPSESPVASSSAESAPSGVQPKAASPTPLIVIQKVYITVTPSPSISPSAKPTISKSATPNPTPVVAQASPTSLPSPIPTISVNPTPTPAPGLLKIALDQSSPGEQVVTPSNDTLLGTWRFMAENQSLKLTRITFSAKGAWSVPVSNFGTLYLKNGSSILSKSVLVNGEVVFTGFTLSIPSSGTLVSLAADLTSSGTQVPHSIAYWAIKQGGSTDYTSMEVLDGSGTIDPWRTSILSSFTHPFLYQNAKPVMEVVSNSSSHNRQRGCSVLLHPAKWK